MPFCWFQILPAGATIHVEHRYRPVPGYSFVTCEALDEDYVKRGFCVNEGFRHKFAARVKAEKNQVMEGADIRYVVRTGAHWLGPIGHFRLMIDKGLAGNLVARCWKEPEGKTTLVFESGNFQPDEDLRFLLLTPLKQEP